MIIKGQEVKLGTADLVRALLNDEYGYNHICKCGVAQTADGCKSMLRIAHQKGLGIDHDYICANCRKSRPCTVFGVEYSSVKLAAKESYDPDKCKCEVCGKVISESQWLQWCQRYLNENDGHIICHSCKSSTVRKSLNKRDHDKLSAMISERNKKNWQDPEYRKRMTDKASASFQKMVESSNGNWEDAEKPLEEAIKTTIPSAMTLMTTNESAEYSRTRGRYVLSQSPFDDNDITKSIAQQFESFLDVIDELHNKYQSRYSAPIILNEDDKTYIEDMKRILDEHSVKSSIYLNYISRFIREGGNHHVLLESIETNKISLVRVNPIEHLQAHFFLFLDNFTRKLDNGISLENQYEVSITQFKIFMAAQLLMRQMLKSVTDRELINDLQRVLKIYL